MASLDQSVSNLSELASRLNDYTNRLNGRLLETQRRLRDSGVGVEMWLDKPIERAGGESFRLGWAKSLRGGWCFYVVSEAVLKHDLNDDSPYPRACDGAPLLNSSRATRAAAFAGVGELVLMLTQVVNSELSMFDGLEDELPPEAAKHAEPRADEVIDPDEIPF